MNNLKQIHLALVMYRENWGAIAHQPAEGILPHELGLPVSVGSKYDEGPLIPYLRSADVFVCPNDYEHYNPSSPLFKAYSYPQHWPPFPYHGSPFLDSCFSLYKQEVKCGERFVLYDCRWHGAHQGTDSFYIILRWNGQVKGHYVMVPITPCWDAP